MKSATQFLAVLFVWAVLLSQGMAATATTTQAPAATVAAQPAAPSASLPAGMLLLPDFNAFGPKATDSVTITLDAPLLAIAARFLDSGNPDERTIKELIGDLQGIYVKSYTFDQSFTYPTADIDAVRKQLATPAWQKIVEVHSGQQQTAVDIFIYQAQQKPRGLTIIATEPRQFTIVNIVGAIDLEKLHKLEGRFGIPKLPSGTGAVAPGAVK